MKNTAAVISIGEIGAASDEVCRIMENVGFTVTYKNAVPNTAKCISDELIKCADEMNASIVLTLGGTGLTKQNVTPDATLAVLDRETPGIAEAMRTEGMKTTFRACLTRGVAGIRGNTLIVNLPGSKSAACENLCGVTQALVHAVDMLASADAKQTARPKYSNTKSAPSMDAWLAEAKADAGADKCGMYLFHTGVVRSTAKVEVRALDGDKSAVSGMYFSYDEDKVDAAVEMAKGMAGIEYVRVWLNDGALCVGDDIMRVLVGGDIRPHVIEALQTLVAEIKNNCVTEMELH